MGDARAEAAWHRASFQVSGYLAFPIVASVIVLISAISAFTDLELDVNDKRGWQIAGGVLCVLGGILLDRRFARYLSALPPLSPQESQEETSLMWWYRVITLGTFAVACLGAYALYRLGLGI